MTDSRTRRDAKQERGPQLPEPRPGLWRIAVDWLFPVSAALDLKICATRRSFLPSQPHFIKLCHSQRRHPLLRGHLTGTVTQIDP